MSKETSTKDLIYPKSKYEDMLLFTLQTIDWNNLDAIRIYGWNELRIGDISYSHEFIVIGWEGDSVVVATQDRDNKVVDLDGNFYEDGLKDVRYSIIAPNIIDHLTPLKLYRTKKVKTKDG